MFFYLRAAADPREACRKVCLRCWRSGAACLCDLVRATAHLAEGLVLQDPLDAWQAKNSVALLRLSPAQYEVVFRPHFEAASPPGLLLRPGRQTLLLYADVPTVLAPALVCVEGMHASVLHRRCAAACLLALRGVHRRRRPFQRPCIAKRLKGKIRSQVPRPWPAWAKPAASTCVVVPTSADARLNPAQGLAPAPPQ